MLVSTSINHSPVVPYTGSTSHWGGSRTLEREYRPRTVFKESFLCAQLRSTSRPCVITETRGTTSSHEAPSYTLPRKEVFHRGLKNLLGNIHQKRLKNAMQPHLNKQGLGNYRTCKLGAHDGQIHGLSFLTVSKLPLSSSLS